MSRKFYNPYDQNICNNKNGKEFLPQNLCLPCDVRDWLYQHLQEDDSLLCRAGEVGKKVLQVAKMQRMKLYEIATKMFHK